MVALLSFTSFYLFPPLNDLFVTFSILVFTCNGLESDVASLYKIGFHTFYSICVEDKIQQLHTQLGFGSCDPKTRKIKMHMQEPSGHSSKRVVAKTKENTSIPLFRYTKSY